MIEAVTRFVTVHAAFGEEDALLAAQLCNGSGPHCRLTARRLMQCISQGLAAHCLSGTWCRGNRLARLSSRCPQIG